MPGEGLSGEHGCPLPGGTVGSAWWSRLFGRVSGNLTVQAGPQNPLARSALLLSLPAPGGRKQG